jgi:hypothetical protein
MTDKPKTAREIAIMAVNRALDAPPGFAVDSHLAEALRVEIESALLAYGDQKLEEAAKMAETWGVEPYISSWHCSGDWDISRKLMAKAVRAMKGEK